MALFKICRGNEENLPTTLTDGYAYFCTDTGSFYIDYTNSNGVLARKMIKAEYAAKAGGVYDTTDSQYMFGHLTFSADAHEMSQMVKRGRYEDLLDKPFGKVPIIYQTNENGSINAVPATFGGSRKIYMASPGDAPLCSSCEIKNVPSPVRGANYIFTLDGTQYACTARHTEDICRTMEDGSIQHGKFSTSDTGGAEDDMYYWGNIGLTGLTAYNSDNNYYGEDTGESYLILWKQGNLVIYLANELKDAYDGLYPVSSLVPAEEYFTIDEKYLPDCVVTEEMLEAKGYATKEYVDDAVANSGGSGSGSGATGGAQGNWAQNDSSKADYIKNRPGAYVVEPAVTYTFDGNFEGKECISISESNDGGTFEYRFLRIGDCVTDPNRLLGVSLTAKGWQDTLDSEPFVSVTSGSDEVIDYSSYFDLPDGTVYMCMADDDIAFANITSDIDAALLISAIFNKEVESTPASSGLYTMNYIVTQTETDEESGEVTTTVEYTITTEVTVPELVAKLPEKFVEKTAPGGYWYDGATYTYDGNSTGKYTATTQRTSGTKTYDYTYVRISEQLPPATVAHTVIGRIITTAQGGTVTEDMQGASADALMMQTDIDGTAVMVALGVEGSVIVAYSDLTIEDLHLKKKGLYVMDVTTTDTSTGEVVRQYVTQVIFGSGAAKWPGAMLESRVTAQELTLYSSSWSGATAPYTYSLSVTGLKSADDGMIGLSKSASSTQADAARNAMIRVTSQSDGTLTLAADGTKPTTGIPVTVMIL